MAQNKLFWFDSHCDTPSQIYRLGRDLGEDNHHCHVDFPKMRRGGSGGAFFALYTPPAMEPDAATRYALEMLAGVMDTLDRHPSEAVLVRSPEEARAAIDAGQLAIAIGMENASPIQRSLPLLREFRRLGVSYITLTHNGDNEVADAASHGTRWGGISPFGREVVAEMNRLGIMIDLSHAHDRTFWDALEISKAPVMASHSCCRELCPHRRNLTDDMLRALGEKGGYVGINFYPSFLSPHFLEDPAEAALMEEADRIDAAFRADTSSKEKLLAWQQVQDRLLEIWRPGVREVADHIDHAVSLAGIDHVGIGSDYDGIEVGPAGLENISKMPLLEDELMKRGYSAEQIAKIAGGNLLSFWERVRNKK